jgi:hypothetical protein
VKRDKGYSHHFVIISITSMTEELDAVTVGQYTFNNISAIAWQSVLLVEKTRVPGENNRLVAIH